MKNNSNQYKDIQNNNNIVSLYDCFYYNQKSELFTGENKNHSIFVRKILILFIHLKYILVLLY